MFNHDDIHGNSILEAGFEPARFPIRLRLPTANAQLLLDAREAIQREYRDSVEWKRLRCRRVEVLSTTDTGTVFILDIGHAVEFDWTWEGAVAFRPSLSDNAEDPESWFHHQPAGVDIEDSLLWSGEILEVDEATGRIFVVVADPEFPPTTGSFFVRPFEFLAFLHAVFQEPTFEVLRERLPSRLAAAEGGIHPDVDAFRELGLPELRRWWSRAWSILWGPPGTGKTHTTGQQVADVIADPSERVLVLSTTNRATDAAAIAIGRAARKVAAEPLASGALLRIGKGASWRTFESADLASMLRGTETEFLAQTEGLLRELARARDPEEKALIRKQIKEVRERMRDAAQWNFRDQQVRVVVATAFRATTFLKCEDVRMDIEQGFAPFTTVFIDEAGLISRAAVAALSLLASRRVVLVGDSKQLAPISRISRILPTSQMTWLANSGLSHLETISVEEVGVHVLRQQRRMHADVCCMVSHYQYDGLLTTALEVNQRTFEMPDVFHDQPRTIWYVLDDDDIELPLIRAERGAGNRSWVRQATEGVLTRLFTDPSLRDAQGLFISPFKAQVKEIGSFLSRNDLHCWSASTVHSQQGSEADIVIFDTVNAGSCGWPYDEWKRLVNVALSRSRELVMVLASRAEMNEPYLRPLLRYLAPRVLRKQGERLVWETVPTQTAYLPPHGSPVPSVNSVGHQLARRKELRPVMSQEQERLCALELDGKPRLVRGVAGSGKTVILAHWLMQTVKRLAGQPNVRIWVVFANRSLQSLIGDSIESAWAMETGGKSFPWDRVSLRHIRDILDVLLPEVGLSVNAFGFDYDAAAAAYLQRQATQQIKPRCDALFIDEAQDMGPHALKLLAAIARQVDDRDGNSRSVNIFYDNAQNIYGRGTPTWSELGLGMRGRSTVMKESFRGTKPIAEYALNVLYRLKPPDSSPDHRELVSRGLIERTQRAGLDWWSVRFNQVDGPLPTFREYLSGSEEFEAIAAYCRELIEVEHVQPSDICLIYNSQNVKARLESLVAPRLRELGVEFSVQTSKPFHRDSNTLLATTSHSFKGYDSEVVIIPAADQYVAGDQGILANSLYVAMTRARSLLTIYSQRTGNWYASRLNHILADCLDGLHERPKVESEISLQDDWMDILDIIGHEFRSWLVKLWSLGSIQQEPLLAESGEILAEPLFWFRSGNTTYACFGLEGPRRRVLQHLEEHGVRLLELGQKL